MAFAFLPNLKDGISSKRGQDENIYQEYLKALSVEYTEIPIEIIDKLCQNSTRYENTPYYCSYMINNTLNIFKEFIQLKGEK